MLSASSGWVHNSQAKRRVTHLKIFSEGIIGYIALLAGLCFLFVQGEGIGKALLLIAMTASVAIHGLTAVVFALIMVVARFSWVYYRSRFANSCPRIECNSYGEIDVYAAIISNT
jgi:hypothetical protein